MGTILLYILLLMAFVVLRCLVYTFNQRRKLRKKILLQRQGKLHYFWVSTDGARGSVFLDTEDSMKNIKMNKCFSIKKLEEEEVSECVAKGFVENAEEVERILKFASHSH